MQITTYYYGNGTAKTLTLSFKLSSKVNKSDCYFHKSTQGSEGDGELKQSLFCHRCWRNIVVELGNVLVVRT